MDAAKIYQHYRCETDEEIERKRNVIRSLILNGQDVDYNEARMAQINRVVHERQRRKERREWLAELTVWGKLVAPFGGGVVVTLVWKFMAQKFGLPGGY
jgi:hypothetical protein